MAERQPAIGEARGLGAMRALELVKDRATKAPDKERTAAAVQRACESGLLLISAGTHGNVLRILVPLVVGDDELDEGLEVLERALR
jgi:4-aminobutyrate aminotransferase/(S)-3-amino-2-methylpropionate transaminase